MVRSVEESPRHRDTVDPPSLHIPYPQPENKLSVHINVPISAVNPQTVETIVEVENNLQGKPKNIYR